MSAVYLDAEEIPLVLRGLSALREADLTEDETAVIAWVSCKLGRAMGDILAAGS